jgi:hypothetical protein
VSDHPWLSKRWVVERIRSTTLMSGCLRLGAHAEITAELVRNDPWSCAMDVADHVEDVDDKFIRPCCYLVEVAEVLDEQVRWLLVGGRRRSSTGRHARTNERNYCVSPIAGAGRPTSTLPTRP